MSEERDEIEDVEELEEVVEEPAVEEGEAETSDLLIGLDQISTMIYVTEIWDSLVSGEISVDDAKKLLNRNSALVRDIKKKEEEAEEEAKKTRPPKKAPKKKTKG